MTKDRNFDNFGASTLPNVFSEANAESLQAMASNLMQAVQEAQGMLLDSLNGVDLRPPAPGQADPFGGLDAQMKLGAALARNPEKSGHAMMTLFQGWMNLFQAMASNTPMPRDRRFADPEWEANPAFSFMRRAWMLNAEWLQGLIDTVSDDLDEATELKARYYMSQFVDAMSPTNLMATNPAALRAMVETKGESVLEGLRNARQDFQRGGGRLAITQTDEDAYEIGKNVATAKGKVIFRNKLIEIIHYNPTRKKMREIPMLIFPPWINKFYILDLQPENSMIRWLLSKRVNTFVVSWRSADDETKDYTWDDYIEHGILAALDAVTKEADVETVNSIGYCIGGTLLSTALAHMGKTGDTRIASATYFASQSDFELAGELKIFTGEAGLQQVDNVIEENNGIMPGEMMGETFNWLRPADLVWRYVVDNYMMGKQPRPFDLLYWNADQTNIPGPTHKTYLTRFYNQNAFSQGKFEVFGDPVEMSDIEIPVFIQASRSDHICPWHSIYKGAQNFGGPVRFTMAGSGHIAGVINHPDAQKYQHWVNPELPENPGRWLSDAEELPGSWWPSWWEWLKPLSGAKVKAVTPKDHRLGEAPGQYAALKLKDIAAGAKPAGPYSDGTAPTPGTPMVKKKPSYRMPAGWRPRT
ncbi:MAG: class I poly(R)-hydroxyalkanoic acid synthase [Hyphomonadaceae bacterium]|nr:class I poly(R)-hydroxyalkanoic acid synthase [Hyphomonadaceae bacterium]